MGLFPGWPYGHISAGNTGEYLLTRLPLVYDCLLCPLRDLGRQHALGAGIIAGATAFPQVSGQDGAVASLRDVRGETTGPL